MPAITYKANKQQKLLFAVASIFSFFTILLFALQSNPVIPYEIFSPKKYWTNFSLGHLLGYVFAIALFIFKVFMAGEHHHALSEFSIYEKILLIFFILIILIVISFIYLKVSLSNIDKLTTLSILIGLTTFENGAKPIAKQVFKINI